MRMKPTWPRRILQLGILGSVIFLALGLGRRSFEAFCPFGGMEAAWALFRERAYTCTLSEMNVAMLLGVLALTLLAGKAFCSWVCPIGFINEMLYKLGRRIPGLRRVEVPLRADRWLRLLRYPFTILMLVLTWKAGELLLRGYDPFFLIFSGFGHGALGVVSWLSLGVIVLGALAIPMLWCRYLCPLGAVMDLLARFGLVRVHRSEPACTGCGDCDKVCLQRLDVSRPASIASPDCTRCLDCLESCPTGALELRIGPPVPMARRRPAWKLLPWLVPVPVIAAIFFGVRLAEPLTLPTATAAFFEPAPGQKAQVTFTVDGVKCRGTSNFFIQRASGFPGVAGVEAYAGTHRVEIVYDRGRITPEALRDSINAPVVHPTTGELIPGVFTCTSMKVR
jgi:NapH/MauN family ferredoxin-type protein